MAHGYLCLMLHAHLPFVRHPEEEYFLEENWLFEAITETYIPLIQVFEGLVRDEIDFRITMSMTPPLVAMLKDQLLQDRYLRHINKLIELSEKEIQRTKNHKELNHLALTYNKKFHESRDVFVHHYQKNIVNAFKKFQDLGCLEIITCCATHGFLPILGVDSKSAQAQIEVGVEQYRQAFGRLPKGIWLPECGYQKGVDDLLEKAGIRFFFIDSHGIINSDPSPKYNVYAPLFCPAGVAAFGRDWESSKQVWSADEGYPGDANYREYYRDIGHELDFEYIKPYIHPDGIRVNTGIKYSRITGKSDHKELYNFDWARDKAAEHAGNFMFNREKQIEHLSTHMDRPPIIVAPYDAELFGHWWYEGPQWINFLMRKIACDQNTIELITPSDYLERHPVNQVAQPSASSWGYKGYNEFWLNGGNDWIYPHLHNASKQMVELAKLFEPFLDKPKSNLKRRALNQAARELLLAEASDWPFIMKTGTMVPYAHRRVKQHINRFIKLYNDLKNDTINKLWLEEVESRDNIFHSIDCAKYYLQLKTKTIKRKTTVKKVAKKTVKKATQKKSILKKNKK